MQLFVVCAILSLPVILMKPQRKPSEMFPSENTLAREKIPESHRLYSFELVDHEDYPGEEWSSAAHKLMSVPCGHVCSP